MTPPQPPFSGSIANERSGIRLPSPVTSSAPRMAIHSPGSTITSSQDRHQRPAPPGPRPAGTKRRQRTGLEADRDLATGRQQQQPIGDSGELLDRTPAIGADGEVLERPGALLAVHYPKGELGSELFDVLRPRLAHLSASSRARSFIIALRIRVFTVPTGSPSSSEISLAVRPR